MAEGLMTLIWNGKTSGARLFALKSTTVAYQYGKSPIQVGIPFNDPQLIDLNIVRPTFTVSGLVDKVITGDSVTGPSKGGGTNYKVPTKQDIEDFVTDNAYDASNALTMMFIMEDDTYEQYEFAIQQFTANLAPAKEDRYDFTMVVLARKRAGTYNQVTSWP